MLKITQSPRFWSAVTVETPREEGGKPQAWDFDIEFPRLTSPQMKKLNDHILAKKLDDDEVATLLILGGWVDVVDWEEGKKPVDPVVMKWKRIVGEDDQLLPVSAENVKKVLAVMGVGSAICGQFFKEIRKAALGN